MNSYAIKSLVICTLGAALLAACGSPQPTQVASSKPSNIVPGKLIAVEAASGQSTAPSSSGSSAGATASNAPVLVTVQYADGTQGRFMVEQQKTTFKVGDPVGVIVDGDRVTMIAAK
jgi:hypothetical protein